MVPRYFAGVLPFKAPCGLCGCEARIAGPAPSSERVAPGGTVELTWQTDYLHFGVSFPAFCQLPIDSFKCF